jgi:hypothetical protein
MEMATEHKTYMVADNGHVQIWVSYALNTCYAVIDGDVIARQYDCTISDVERMVEIMC